MLNLILPISLKILNFKNFLSENLISFLLEYILFLNKFKQFNLINEFHSNILKQILLICKNNIMINLNEIKNISLDENDEEYLKFQNYRNVNSLLFSSSYFL